MRGIQALVRPADRQAVTRGTSLRRSRPAALRAVGKRTSVEALNLQIQALVAERQQLRFLDAGAAALEQNRLRIVRAQWALAQALIERHLSEPAAA
jgi:hypothetical protein